MTAADPATRRRLGRIFIGIGVLMLAAGAVFGAGAVPLSPPGGSSSRRCWSWPAS